MKNGLKQKKRQKGFTLIEIIVVIALLSLLVTMMSVFVSQSLKSYRVQREGMDLEDQAAHIMREFERTARAGTQIITADNNEFKFYRYFDLSSISPTQVRYFMSGNQFKIGYTQPSGTPPNVTYPIENEQIQLIVDNVVNIDTLFKYYDGSSNLLSGSIDSTKVRMVELTISLDQDQTKPPAPVAQSTRVSLRNMKDNL